MIAKKNTCGRNPGKAKSVNIVQNNGGCLEGVSNHWA